LEANLTLKLVGEPLKTFGCKSWNSHICVKLKQHHY